MNTPGWPVMLHDASLYATADPHWSPLDPHAGETVVVGRAASVQFAEPFAFRVSRVHARRTFEGWAWMDGYRLGSNGDAVEWRQIFVQVAGLGRKV